MLCVRSTPAIHFYRYALRSVHARHTFLSICFAFGSRLLFAACAPNRTACGMFRSYSAVGRDRHSCVLACHTIIGRVRFFMAIPTENERTERRGERSRRRGKVRFYASALALPCFLRGVRWGKMRKPHCGRAPNLRQRVECGSRTAASLDSLHLIRGRVPLAKHSNNCYSRTAAPTSRSTRVHGKTLPSPIYARQGRAIYR